MFKSLKAKMGAGATLVAASASSFAVDHTAAITAASTDATTNVTAAVTAIVAITAIVTGVGLILKFLGK